jgi:spermidine synthase/tetratricopeptide (TPR) repeat protein
LSGALALAQEVAWSELLARSLGHGTGAVSIVTAIFLAGLASGYAWGGRQASRWRRPLALYGALEVGIALLSLVLVDLLPRLPDLTAHLGSRVYGQGLAGVFWRALIAAPCLFPVTFLMGATLPALARWRAADERTAALASGRLAGVNAAGGALGALGAIFVFLPAHGTRATLLGTVALGLACGLGALLLGRSHPGAAGGGERTTPTSATVDLRPGGIPLPALLLVAGTASLAAQMAWTRSLSWLVGSSVYAFGLILAATVGGMALGSLLVASPARKSRDPLALFARLELLLGVAVMSTVALLPVLPAWVARLAAAAQHQPRLVQAGELGLTLGLLLVPAALIGAAFPPACRLLTAKAGDAGRGVGRAGAWLTAGNVIGTLAAGFLLPRLAGSRTVLLGAGLAFVAVGAAAGRGRPRMTRRWWTLAAAALVLPLLVPVWDPALMASGPAINGPYYVAAARAMDRSPSDAMRERGEIVFVEEGADALVTIRRGRAGQASLQINGRTEASSGADLTAQILAAQIPLLHAEDPRRVMVIGLASGVTAGSILTRDPERLVVAELAPTVLHAAASGHFDAVSGRPLADPRVEVILADARTVLLHDSRRYDLIASQPSNPWVPGVAGLYTREFFRLVHRRLEPGGVFGQWVQAYGMTVHDFRSILRTFAGVFPHCALYEESVAGGDYFLVGSPEPLERDASVLLRRLTPAVRADLERVGVTRPSRLLARRVLNAGGVAAFAEPGEILTDDRLRLAFTTPLSMWLQTASFQAAALERGRSPMVLDLDLQELEPRARQHLLAGLSSSEEQRREDWAFVELLEGVALEELARPRVAEAVALARAGLPRAAYAALLPVLETDPGPAALQILAGDLARRLREPELAEVHYRAALAARPASGAALLGLGTILLQAGQLDEALFLLQKATIVTPDWARAWSNLGVALRRQGRQDEAVSAYRRALSLEPRLSPAWYNLGRLLEMTGDLPGAAAAYRQGIKAAPEDCDLRRALAGILSPPGDSLEAKELLRPCLTPAPAGAVSQAAPVAADPPGGASPRDTPR